MAWNGHFGWYRPGLHRAYRFDGSIATLYVDGVALAVRMYDEAGEALRFDVVDGALDILELATRD